MFRWLGIGKAGAGNRACFLLFPLLMVASGPAIAADPGVTVEDSHPGCHVRGSFEAPVTPELAWRVLTDYDHISEFVHSMQSSRIERRGSDSLLVRQHATSGFFIFHRHVEVLLDVREEPPGLIRFRDVLGTDFHTYAGVWRIESDEDETRVTYELTADPNPAVPQAFYRGVLRGVARDLLSEVRAEMLRRAAERQPPAD
jgi:carbon monoxide dehydrogenase subunit G